jgi:FHS family glucose/mannose:H+ symporter-like MFS transporter
MSTAPAVPDRIGNRTGLLALLFTGFALIGIPTVIIGPILPLFISRWSLNDAQAGLFFTVQFAASLCGTWITTALTAWYGYRPGLAIGYLLTGVGLALLNAPTHTLALVATASFGMGYGIAIPPSNLSAAEAGGKRSAGLVSLLNFAWGIGAVACSPLIMLALRHEFLPALLYTVAFCGLVLGVSFLFVSFPADKHAQAAESGSSSPSIPAHVITAGVAVLFFVYVGIETGVGGWAAEYVKRLAGHGSSLSTIAPMFFYAGLTTGRGLASLVLLRFREIHVVLSALGLAVLGIVVIIATASPRTAIVGLSIAGFGCASIYPIYISWFSKWYGAAARRLGGVFFSMASFGGAVMPWVVGLVSTQVGSLRIGLLVPLAGCFIMLGGLALLHRQRLV